MKLRSVEDLHAALSCNRNMMGERYVRASCSNESQSELTGVMQVEVFEHRKRRAEEEEAVEESIKKREFVLLSPPLPFFVSLSCVSILTLAVPQLRLSLLLPLLLHAPIPPPRPREMCERVC